MWALHSVTSHPRVLFPAPRTGSDNRLLLPPTLKRQKRATKIYIDMQLFINTFYAKTLITIIITSYLKVSSCSCSSCVCSWRCLRPAGLFMSSIESDWLSLSIRTWFSTSKLLFSSCKAATCVRKGGKWRERKDIDRGNQKSSRKGRKRRWVKGRRQQFVKWEKGQKIERK